MKFSLNALWLLSPIQPIHTSKWSKELAHVYSTHSAEIEGITEIGIDGVVVGKVLSTARHPESQKLWVTEVDLWSLWKVTILTGAQNIPEATYVAVATVGTKLAPDFEIVPRKMIDMMSYGMMCGKDELWLTKIKQDGIIILEECFDEKILESSIGKPFFDLSMTLPNVDGTPVSCPIRDTIFEIENKNITNRPDLFWLEWNAREFSTLFSLPLKTFSSSSSSSQNLSGVNVRIDTPNVLTYSLLAIENVTVTSSPFGFSVLLERLDHVPHSNMVDITNMVMSEIGQPMHVFDADTIVGTISVRQAKKGESMEALDGKIYELDESIMVIADEEKILAIAGIIGWLSSSVTEKTKRVLFEAATFDATSVRLAAQKLACRTESSTRFEKSLDPLLPQKALARTKELLAFMNQPNTSDIGFFFQDEKRIRHIELTLEISFIEKRIGQSIPRETIVQILTSLGFSLTIKSDELTIIVPSWRASKDISIREDIVEEIARVYGYDAIEELPFEGVSAIAKKASWSDFRFMTTDFFVGECFMEVYNYSFSNEEKEKSVLLDWLENTIAIRNAVSSEFTILRRTPAPLLLLNAQMNAREAQEFSFFEIATIHSKENSSSFSEKKCIAGIIVGGNIQTLRNTLDSYIVQCTGQQAWVIQGVNNSTEPYYHPNASGTYLLWEKKIGTFWKIHPRVLQNYELEEREVLFFHFDVEYLFELFAKKTVLYHEPSKYPVISRELNFVMEVHESTGKVAWILEWIDPLVSEVRVEDIFIDEKKVGTWKKSVTFSFILRSFEGTITDEEALSIQNRLIEKMNEKGYSLRMT